MENIVKLAHNLIQFKLEQPWLEFKQTIHNEDENTVKAKLPCAGLNPRHIFLPASGRCFSAYPAEKPDW